MNDLDSVSSYAFYKPAHNFCAIVRSSLEK
jgi:hypothetical protein